jgi:hypothetical protein
MRTSRAGAPLSTICAALIGLFSINQTTNFIGQGSANQTKRSNKSIRCVIYTERRDWDPANAAIVYGTIENLFDGPIEVTYWPALYLSASGTGPESHWAAQGRFVALVDLFPGDHFSAKSNVVENQAGRDHALRLKFKQKGDKVDFQKIDVRKLIWSNELASAGPYLKLFAVVPPGSYDLKLQLENAAESCESAKIRVTISGKKHE